MPLSLAPSLRSGVTGNDAHTSSLFSALPLLSMPANIIVVVFSPSRRGKTSTSPAFFFNRPRAPAGDDRVRPALRTPPASGKGEKE